MVRVNSKLGIVSSGLGVIGVDGEEDSLCYIRSDFCFNFNKRLHDDVECIMFEVLFFKSKPFSTL